MTAAWYRWEKNDLILSVRLQPRASRDEISGVQGEYLKIRLTSPPVDGKANEHLFHFLAEVFDVPKSHITLIRGDTQREKHLRIASPRRLPPIFPQ